MNAINFQAAVESNGVPTRVMTAFSMQVRRPTNTALSRRPTMVTFFFFSFWGGGGLVECVTIMECVTLVALCLLNTA